MRIVSRDFDTGCIGIVLDDSHLQWLEIHSTTFLFPSNIVELTSSAAQSTCKHGERG